MTGTDETMTAKEAAAALGVSDGRVRQMIRDGLLESVKRGRDNFIPVRSVEAAKQRKTQPGPAPTTGASQRRRDRAKPATEG